MGVTSIQTEVGEWVGAVPCLKTAIHTRAQEPPFSPSLHIPGLWRRLGQTTQERIEECGRPGIRAQHGMSTFLQDILKGCCAATPEAGPVVS